MGLVSFAIRALPLTLIRKQIKNPFFQSFLYYMPYITLSVMTFPAIMDVCDSPYAGLLALAIGVVSAWIGLGLFPVSAICCVVVFICSFF